MSDVQIDLPLVVSVAAVLVALVSTVIAYRALRLNRNAFETGGHDIALDVDVEMGGVAEMHPDQPVHLIVDLFNRGRGPVTVVDMQLQFAPWDAIAYVKLTDGALVSPSELSGRVEGNDHKRYVFEMERAARHRVVEEDTLSLRRIRLLAKRKGYPAWVVVRLGDGKARGIQLGAREGQMVRQEVFGQRRGRTRLTDRPFTTLPDRGHRLYMPSKRGQERGEE